MSEEARQVPCITASPSIGVAMSFCKLLQTDGFQVQALSRALMRRGEMLSPKVQKEWGSGHGSQPGKRCKKQLMGGLPASEGV